MSNYNLTAKSKITGKISHFEALDNFFGQHRYGYRDKDKTYNEKDFLKLYVITN